MLFYLLSVLVSVSPRLLVVLKKYPLLGVTMT